MLQVQVEILDSAYLDLRQVGWEIFQNKVLF